MFRACGNLHVQIQNCFYLEHSKWLEKATFIDVIKINLLYHGYALEAVKENLK